MTDREIAEILLIRSVEEENPQYFDSSVLIDALRMSGGEKSNITLISRRAHYLSGKLPDTIKNIPASLYLARKWIVLSCIAVFVIGVLFNYLGTGDKIHILYNPVVLLIVWNLFIFILFFVRYFFMRKGGSAYSSPGKAREKRKSFEPYREQEDFPEQAYTSFTSRWLLRKLWFSLHKQFVIKKQDVKRISSSLKVTYRFMELWWDMNHNVYIARFIRFIHLLAICLVLGALTGIYIRGLFFEYNVVWKSTFIHDPEKIALILNIIFGLPSQVLNGVFIDETGISLLSAPSGLPAASWIHLFAVSAAMFVIPERLFLILLESGRIKSQAKKRVIELAHPYYARHILLAEDMQASRLRDEISSVVNRDITRLAESIAAYVQDNFYDTHIVPQFIRFRNNGGRVRDLETEIERESEKFRDTLNNFLEGAQDNFRKSLSDGVSEIIGKKLFAIEVDVGKQIHVKPETYREALDESVTRNMTNAIGVAVTAAVAATAGTISGGFGKVLGIAIVSTILHTTGPVGFLIGAVAGLLLGGGAAVLAKDKITDVVKNQKFPAFSTQMLLRESKLQRMIEEGRSAVYRLIKAETESKLLHQGEDITNQILSRIAIPSKQASE
ncbi:MAG: hypothetical protein AMK71_01805 [Nitrospira bacterium SG8_35_4]|nr:MAG: hypothetical protein AMK71_01805 [Nitrospira bacterium SG8_35_4]